MNTNALLINTCNRTEIYYCGKKDEYNDLYKSNKWPTFHYEGRVAVRHIIEVCCGIKSAVLGDYHIFHQMKKGYSNADVSEEMHRLMRYAFRAAKSIQTNNSVPKQAVKDAGSIRSALIVGAGQMAEDLISHLKCDLYIPRSMRSEKILYITNRTRKNAEALPGETIDWNRREEVGEKVDVVFVCTAAPSPIFESNENMTVYDLSNPRNVKGKANSLEDLKTSKAEGIYEAKKICRKKTNQYMDWLETHRRVDPKLKLLNKRMESIRSKQIDKYGKECMSHQEVEKLTKSIKEKTIGLAAKNLKEGAQSFEEVFS